MNIQVNIHDETQPLMINRTFTVEATDYVILTDANNKLQLFIIK